jgi:hypothetical protein
MAQLINSSINLTLDGANGASIPQGTLVYRSPGTTVDVPATVTIPASSASSPNFFRDAGGTEALSGTLRSPNWPGDYPANCNGYTFFPGLTGITRTLSGTVTTEQNFDFIRVYEGSGITGKMLYQVTGSLQQFSFTSAAGQAFTVQFVSDESSQFIGFSLTVTGERVGTYLSYDSGVSSPYIIGEDGEPSQGYRSTTVTRYDANGTWLNPLYLGENISMVFVFLLGGGGGGAKGPITSSDSRIPRGGAGAAASLITYPAFALGPVYPITVGAGGLGSTSTENPNGSSGGTSSFGNLPGTTDALTGGSCWFSTVYAGGGSGGALSLTPAEPGGYGLYVGAAAGLAGIASLYYEGPSGGRGGYLSANSDAGAASGTRIGSVAGGAAGSNSTTGGAGGNGTTPAKGLRSGSSGGGGGKASTATTGGKGGDGGLGAGGGGGGGVVTEIGRAHV